MRQNESRELCVVLGRVVTVYAYLAGLMCHFCTNASASEAFGCLAIIFVRRN